MNNIMIFGSGQAGRMIANWISADLEILGFIDNNHKLWGQYISNLKIYSVKESLEMIPDMIVITVLNQEASKEIEMQLKSLNYEGTIFNINDLKKYIDLRLSSLRLIASEIDEKKLEGCVAELGVYKGKFAVEINKLFPDKKLYLFDTFEGFFETDVALEKEYKYSKAQIGDFSDTSIELVKDKLVNKEQAVFVKGYFPESIKEDLPTFCFVSLDTDLYKPTYQGLKIFYSKLVKGGIILIHDYNSAQFPGVKKAVREFCDKEDVFVVPLSDMHGSAVLIKN